MRCTRQRAAEQIEGQELDVPHSILDVVAEDVEVEHIAADMGPTAVHKHRPKNGQIDRVRSRIESQSGTADSHQAHNIPPLGNLSGHHAVTISEFRVTELIDEDHHIQRDQGPGNDWKAPPHRIVVADWKEHRDLPFSFPILILSSKPRSNSAWLDALTRMSFDCDA